MAVGKLKCRYATTPHNGKVSGNHVVFPEGTKVTCVEHDRMLETFWRITIIETEGHYKNWFFDVSEGEAKRIVKTVK